MRHFLPAIALLLILAAPAQADTFDVVGRGDAGGGCSAIGPQLWQCQSLRDAVTTAAGTAGAPHGILLHAGGPYVLASELPVASDVILAGEGARATTIQAGPSARVLSVGGTAQVTLANLTVQGGNAVSTNGGNLLVGANATLSILNVHVTAGTANAGGGIANEGQLLILNSLIAGNTAGLGGGGILNDGAVGAEATLSVSNSTITGNSVADGDGAGIESVGNASNTVTLNFVTLARNLGSGLSVSAPADQQVSATGSIFANNAPNCTTLTFDLAQSNLDDGTTCNLPAGTNRPSTNPQLATALSDQGGQTNVLAFQDPSSLAIDYASPCFAGTDQRGYTRVTDPFTEPCDAGAFELSGIAPPSQPPPEQTPIPTPAQPTPVPTPTPSATPVANRSVAVDAESGALIKRNGRFVPLVDGVVPNGSEIDTKKGAVTITTSTGDKAKFFDGIFKIAQTGGLTTLTLSEALDCKKAKGSGSANAAAKKPKTRKLWGDGKGRFKTKGTYSAATVRGTKWLVQDTCTTTTTRVTVGAVSVRDDVLKKTVVVRKGKSYVARAKKR